MTENHWKVHTKSGRKNLFLQLFGGIWLENVLGFGPSLIISLWIYEQNLKPRPTVQKRRVVIALGRHSKKKEALEWRRLKINLHCFQQERLAIARVLLQYFLLTRLEALQRRTTAITRPQTYVLWNLTPLFLMFWQLFDEIFFSVYKTCFKRCILLLWIIFLC